MAGNFRHSLDILDKIVEQNVTIIKQNSDILIGVNQLLLETNDSKRIQNEQLIELKKVK